MTAHLGCRVAAGQVPAARGGASGLAQCGARPLVPIVGDEDGLRLVPAREHDVLAEQPDLRDDLGEVVPDLGHSHALFGGRIHALRIHTRRTFKSVALYNSGMLTAADNGPSRHTENRHNPSGKTCVHFLSYDLTCDEYDQLTARSGGCCEICRTPEGETVRGSLVIDHFQCGDLFFVRGLLCDRCNSVMSRHDRTAEWGPSSLPWQDKARAYHLNAFGRPTAADFQRADELIRSRKPYAVRDRGPLPKQTRRPRVPRIRLDHGPTQIARALRKHLAPEKLTRLIELLSEEEQ